MVWGVLIGAVVGGLVAYRRGGKPLDIAQYAGAFAIIFAIFGVFLLIIADRMAIGG